MVMLFMFEGNCNSEMSPQHVTCSLKLSNLVLVCYAATIPKPN